MLDGSEKQRLADLYDQLRLKLLDLSKKNRMLNYSLGARSKRHLQIVDEVLDEVYKKLVEEEASLRILHLDEPDDIPPEERTEDFISAYQHAKVSDIEYLTGLEALESVGRDDEITLSRLERELGDKVRSQLGLPPRQKKAEINRAEHARSHGIDPNPELQAKISKASHSEQTLQTLKFPDELESVMEKIFSDARLAEQEMGLSTLFLAFGFLEWYESDDSDKKTFAPLLLLPVRLEAEKVRGHEVFRISAREGAAEANLSLQKLLEKNFNRKLPDLETGEDESAASVDDYLERVRAAIQGLARWQVHRWLVLGHFAFGRFAMYADLIPDNWTKHPAEHALVSSILRGTEGSGDGGLLPTIPEDYSIDEPEIEKIAPLLIQDADASQHSALIDVMREKNLVIQGPPGTGKSQTITNIIANALAAGKKVLFLADKQAALEVVKRRLTRAGLGDFCLELHSDKSSPKLVIESLKQRAELGSNGATKVNQPADMAWHENRKEIKAYLDALHAVQSDGKTPFQMIWKALHGRTANSDVIDAFKSVSLPDRLLTDGQEREIIESNLAIFSDASANFTESYGHPAASPWAETKPGDISGYQVSGLIETLRHIQNVSAEIAAFIENTAGFGVAAVKDIIRLVNVDQLLGDPATPDLLPQVAAFDLDELERALTCMAEWHRLTRALAERPDLSNERPQKLPIASALMSAGLPSGLAEHAPAQAYELASATILRNTTIIQLIERFLPILRLFDLDHHVPAGALLPVAVAIQAGAKVMPEHRAWVNAHRDLDLSVFTVLKECWTLIVTNEIEWRGNVPAYGNRAWPDPHHIEVAAATLRKSGIGRAFAALRGSAKAARELVAQFGLQASPDVASVLDQLAEHVRSVCAFEEDQIAAGLLGASWVGVATPFGEIDAGLKLRELFLNRIGELPHGAQVAERLVSLAPESFSVLTETQYVAVAIEFCNSPEEIRTQLDDRRPIEQIEATCREEIAVMQKVLAFDPARTLADIALPIREIAEIADLVAKRDSAQRQIEASPVNDAARILGRTAAETFRATSAINWIRAVHRSDPSPELNAKLISRNATEERGRLNEAAKHGARLLEEYTNLMAQAATEFGMTSLAALAPLELVNRAQSLIGHADELSDFLAISRHRTKLVEAGLGSLLDRADEMKLHPERLPSLLETIIVHRRASRICSSPMFAKNSGPIIDARRRQFADRDRRKIENDRAFVRAKLIQNQPLPGSNYGPRKKWTEMALLRNEFSKQRRFAPVRSLLTQGGRSIQALKPCFMMSPLSLAKFVGANTLQFDLLVIDEASQMKPEEAIGGMLRAQQIVVVGDQKQLPPTDFFNRSSEASLDDDFEDIDDESILEGCQKTFREIRRLKWHYRSRCESLIRFSNENFYKDSPLITFPAAKPGSFSIDLVRVDGIYHGRRNPAEASRIAEEAVTFMRHYADMDEENIPSIGIVAVNIDQRDLIQEELRRLSADDALVDEYREKVATKGEPVFVKNLENVQGDERDFIFISLTYGREPGATAMKQRFGPINGKQGHRRLNVLFTRARMRIGLFTSFGSIDVTPTGTSAEGVHVLKRYLEYAEGRGRAAVEGIGTEADSDFEIEVADRLRARKYAVELQVGVSGFRIDLGVRHPDYPERFLAGVECDGARYHECKSARDRDRLREEVLRGLGWEIVRVWSTDWFDNPARETDKLVKKLEELRLNPRDAYEDYPSIIPVFPSRSMESIAGQNLELEQACQADPPETVAAILEPSLENVSEPSATAGPALPVLDDNEPLTKAQGIQALIEFRENVIHAEIPNWEAHRSILRDAMIEAFVSKHFADPDEWFTKVPIFLRQGTNPIEKNKYLERICEIVSRIDAATHSGASSSEADDFRLTSPEREMGVVQTRPPLGADTKSSKPRVLETASTRQYVVTDFSATGLRPDPSRFYDGGYRTILRQMIALVIATEAPIYEDVLVDRIARAHGFQRSGNNIFQTVTGIIGGEFTRSKDEDRAVIWAKGMQTNKPAPYRECSHGIRSHADIPIAELASIAAPFVRLRMSNEDVLRRMADHFQLGRLREGTRRRFEEALKLTRSCS
jgi:very-short-patch-repair endonuclease/RecA/RadA recombinase